ncbi:MAG: hypothetical protein E7105_09530 [Prevotella sp.]|nr:hypothetical protein [Prevotella sp.]
MKYASLLVLILLSILPSTGYTQSLKVYRKSLGPQSYQTAKIQGLTVKDAIGDAYHQFVYDGASENLFINDIDSILCVIEEEQMSDVTLGDYMLLCLSDEKSGYHIFSKLIAATGLIDTLSLIKDELYEKLYSEGQIDATPQHRYYGYTLFAEQDSFWEKELKKDVSSITIEDIQNYLIQSGKYSSTSVNNDYQDSENVVFQFVAYHVLPVKLSPYQLVIHANEYGFDLQRPGQLSIPVMDYYSTMDNRHILKLYESAESNGVFLNRFPQLDNSWTGTGHEISCEPDFAGIRVLENQVVQGLANGFLYPIDGLLTYDESIKQQLGSTMLRFDIASLLPELMNNGIRRKCSLDEEDQVVHFPSTPVYPYFENMQTNADANVVYHNFYKNEITTYQGDLLTCTGMYDVTIVLPPVPVTGQYQLRMGTHLTKKGTVYQTYFGDNHTYLPAKGIPMDNRIWPDYSEQRGWREDTFDEEHDLQVEKSLHNQGLYKGPKSISCKEYGSARNNPNCLRRILTRELMEADHTYYLRLRCVIELLEDELWLDYIELCPLSIYSGNELEDVW